MMMKLLTDKEAAGKYCPFSFAAPVVPVATAAGWGGIAYGGGGGNFAGNRAGPLRCLRDECMAWQVVTRRDGPSGFCARLGVAPE